MIQIIKILINSLAFSIIKLEHAIYKPLNIIKLFTNIRDALIEMNPTYSSFKINLLIIEIILIKQIYLVLLLSIIFTPLNISIYLYNLYCRLTDRKQDIIKPCWLIEYKQGYTFINNILYNLLYSFKGNIGEDNYYTFLEDIDVINSYDTINFKLIEERKIDCQIIDNLFFKLIVFIGVIWFTYIHLNDHLDILSNSMMGSSPFITFFNKVKSTISKEKSDQFRHWFNNLLNTDYKDRKLTGEDIRVIHRQSTIYLMENNPHLKDNNLLSVTEFLNNDLLTNSCKIEDGFVKLPDSPTLLELYELNKHLRDAASSNSMLTKGKGRIESFGNNTLLNDVDVVFDIKSDTPTIQLNNQPITENQLSPIKEEVSTIPNDLDLGLLYPTRDRSSSKYEGVNILDPSLIDLSKIKFNTDFYKRFKETCALPEIPIVDDLIESLGNRSNPSAPISPISSDIWDTCSTSSSVKPTTFPSSQRNTIDSIRSGLNNSEVTFNSSIVEPSQSQEDLNKNKALVNEIDQMLYDNHKPFLTDDQTS